MQNNVVNLTNLKVKESGYITKINGNLKLKTRLNELGFTKGTLVTILNVSSLKKSFLLEIRGCVLALRYEVVNLIEVLPSKEKN